MFSTPSEIPGIITCEQTSEVDDDEMSTTGTSIDGSLGDEDGDSNIVVNPETRSRNNSSKNNRSKSEV